jgi:type II secretory pathway component GspD/PulD (secretin)
VEKIPLVRLLASNHTKNMSQTTLFVFLRPVILRDDKFRDLKYLSDRDLPQAAECGNFPNSGGPVLVR